MIALDRARIVALARAFDRAEAASRWNPGERRLKARLARRRARGILYLTRRELRWIGEWKTPRVRPEIARNSEVGVRGVTGAAFLARGDSTRLRVLLGLRGVGVAVASVVLHFTDPARYPIYDVRVRTALGRIGVRRRFPPTAAGWVAYAAVLRGLASRHHVSLRTLDKALWRLGGSEAAAGRSPARLRREACATLSLPSLQALMARTTREENHGTPLRAARPHRHDHARSPRGHERDRPRDASGTDRRLDPVP